MCAAFLSIASMLLIGTGLWTDYAHVGETYGAEGSTKGDVFFSVGLIIIGGAGPGIFNGIYTGCLSLPGETRSAFYEAALATLVAGSFDLSSLSSTSLTRSAPQSSASLCTRRFTCGRSSLVVWS